jgi:uncharacterized protein (TIGR00255 family)
MLHSMTAYGRHRLSTAAGEFTWELRSVNNRYLEIFVRLPEEFRALEPNIREVLSNRLSRGKVEVGLKRVDAKAQGTAALSVDKEALKQLLDALNQVSKGVSAGVSASATTGAPEVAAPTSLALLQYPGVLKAPEVDVKAVNTELLAGLDTAITDFVAARAREGGALHSVFVQRIADIKVCLQSLRQNRAQVVARQKERLQRKLSELDVPVDSHRLEQELVYVAQRLDIDEELDRLDHHLVEVQAVLERKEPVGRRLDFLMQELNREANTVASKSSDIDTTGVSVDIKVLIEQMREQVQNVE